MDDDGDDSFQSLEPDSHNPILQDNWTDSEGYFRFFQILKIIIEIFLKLEYPLVSCSTIVTSRTRLLARAFSRMLSGVKVNFKNYLKNI